MAYFPERIDGETQKINTGCGALYLTINHDAEGRPVRIEGHLGKAGGCQADSIEAISRLVTIGLRYGAPLPLLAKTLMGMRCPHPRWQNGSQVLSCADGIAKAIRAWMERHGMGWEEDAESELEAQKEKPACA